MGNPYEIPASVPNDRIWHVVPINDLREHETSDARTCWCRPRVEIEGICWILVHNSLDGREAFEEGRRKPS